MVPSLSNVPSDPNDPASEDARRFPSDEELSQRTLWLCFLIVLGWSILGLAAGLPLYTISIPCVAETGVAPRFLGGYSTLQDLSVLRVLQLLDNRDVSTSSDTTVLQVVNGQDLRLNGQDLMWRGRVRIIVLTVLLVVLGLVPALVKILHEYGKLVAFKNGPSSSLDFSAEPASSGTGRHGRSGRRRQGGPYMYLEEDYGLEVDILSLFTIMYVFSPRFSFGD